MTVASRLVTKINLLRREYEYFRGVVSREKVCKIYT